MTLILSIISGALALLLMIMLVRYTSFVKATKELSEKTEHVLNSPVLLKIEMSRNSLLNKIAQQFNELIRRVQELTKTRDYLQEESEKIRKLDTKLKDFKESISQITLLTDIGKQITSSLDMKEILKTVHHYVSSSMDVEEVELLHFMGKKRFYKSLDRSGKIAEYEQDQNNKRDSVLNWALENNREVLLNDAVADYGQYVFDPIISLSGKKPASLVCIPLMLKDKFEGAIAVWSSKQNAYTSYHIDFIRSIASYLSVAIDNSNVYELLSLSKEEIQQEKDKSEKLLLNILPADIAEELKATGHAEARKIDNVSVLFSDFENFTGISEKLKPEELVADLNLYFKRFDAIMIKYGLEKIKTIGDAYMAAGGMWGNDDGAARNTVLAAIEMQDYIKEIRTKMEAEGRKGFGMRVGIHTGPVVAGIVGDTKFQYDIWGDTVNTASRIESGGVVDKVNISEHTHELVRNEKDLNFEFRGKVEAKNKGEISMYFVHRA
ncbi:MAG: GAF domain-containing protein [Flavobacteriales bacterium]|nr:GAF domain-containing protein [Flavobacteriales bacterium]